MAEEGDKYQSQIDQATADTMKKLESISEQIDAILATAKDTEEPKS